MTVTLGKNIRLLRERENFTQADLARLIGVHEKYVSAMERDRNSPSPALIEKLCAAFGVSEATLRFGDGLENVHPDLKAIIGELSELSPDELLDVRILLRNWRKGSKRVE